MIYLAFAIQNPFPVNDKHQPYGEYVKPKSGRAFTHKAYEFGIYNNHRGDFLFDLTLDTRMSGRDHAGILFNLTIYKLFIEFELYDTRHWDKENNTWQKPDEENHEDI